MDQVKKKHGMSLQKSLILIFSLVVCVISILSGVTIYFASMSQQEVVRDRSLILFSSGDSIPVQNENGTIQIKVDKDNMKWAPLSAEQSVKYYGSYAVMIGIPVILIVLGMSVTSVVYYRKKLRRPILELKNGIVNIQKDNLDFSISYDHPDELGDLCSSMEKMRSELRKKNKRMWELLEERKLLNASVAHDLRTPITILKGYLDYMSRSLSHNKLTKEAEMETLQYMREATGRLERYVDCIRDMETIENLEVRLQEENTQDLMDEMKSNVEQLVCHSDKIVSITTDFTDASLIIDKQLTFRVLENLLQNALRYAKRQISVAFSLKDEVLEATVTDDGEGFSKEALEKAGNALFSSDKDKNHFGFGLYMVRILCEKQNGTLSVRNSPDGGACVTVKIKNRKVTNRNLN